MPKQFIICTEGASVTSEDRDAITRFIEGKGWHLWHWFSDLWLIADAPDGYDPNRLLEEVLGSLAGPRHVRLILIMAAPPDGVRTAGFVPSDGVPWMLKHWAVRGRDPAAVVGKPEPDAQ